MEFPFRELSTSDFHLRLISSAISLQQRGENVSRNDCVSLVLCGVGPHTQRILLGFAIHPFSIHMEQQRHEELQEEWREGNLWFCLGWRRGPQLNLHLEEEMHGM